jgi:uncharacterized membrane protein
VDFVRLATACLAWFLLHAAVAGSGARPWLVGRFGEKAYRGAFSLASAAALWWLIVEYGRAPYRPLWAPPLALSYLPALVMPLACVLLVGAFTVPNPTSAGGERHLAGADATRGVLRVTRHPFLWSAVLWSSAHLLANPDLGSALFFGSMGLTALRGTFDIDRKRRRTHAEDFARFEAVTSNVPLAAVFAGRNRLVARELMLPLGLGLALSLVMALLHPFVFRASAVPGLGG